MERILKIEEVFDVKVKNDYVGYDGYCIETEKHKYMILIDNWQNCCESWGYFISEDDYESFVGKKMISFELTDVALNTQNVEESGYYGDECGGIQFVNIKCSDGTVLQFAVYNDHNGYYGHTIFVLMDDGIILEDEL